MESRIIVRMFLRLFRLIIFRIFVSLIFCSNSIRRCGFILLRWRIILMVFCVSFSNSVWDGVFFDLLNSR